MATALFPQPTELNIVNPLRRDSTGVLRVGQTRVTLDTPITAYEAGATAEEIALNYDALTLSQVYAALAYYLQRKSELASYLAARQEAAKEARATIAQRQARAEIRQRLELRLAAQSNF
jgi:uncharacterized protein (DUF433 family)